MLPKANLARHQGNEGLMTIFGRKLRKRTLYKLAASLLTIIAGLIGISLCYAFTLDDYQTNSRTLAANIDLDALQTRLDAVRRPKIDDGLPSIEEMQKRLFVLKCDEYEQRPPTLLQRIRTTFSKWRG